VAIRRAMITEKIRKDATLSVAADRAVELGLLEYRISKSPSKFFGGEAAYYLTKTGKTVERIAREYFNAHMSEFCVSEAA
jgi:hypothetical protein